MVFLLIILMIILALITIRIKVEFINFEFKSENKEHLNNNYLIKITIYIFQSITIFKLKLTNTKINKIKNNKKIQEKIKKQEKKLIENKQNIDIATLKKIFKNIKININEVNLKIMLGTENAFTTALIIPIISTIIAKILRKEIDKYNQKQKFIITPIFNDKNLINIKFSGVFEIKINNIRYI